jgi:CubicO group peptidase (beta-lactamase class C family)
MATADAELAGLLAEHAARAGVPGAALGVLRRGEATVVFHGVSDVNSGEPVGPETRFPIGSLTKTLAATAVARLADARRLALDDPVAERVPQLEDVGWARQATVRDLLANRSRVPLLERLEFAPPDDPAELVSRLAAAEPSGPFWSYSNAGWCLVGRVLETATGLPWEEAMRAAVLEPLGLSETSFAGPRATGHAGSVPVAPWSSQGLAPAGGTTLSTAADLLRLAQAHLDEPWPAMLREAQPSPRIHGWLDGWCLGLARYDRAARSTWGWEGLLPGHRSALRLDLAHRAAVVVLANGDRGRLLSRSLLAELWDLPPLRLEPVPGAAGDLARFEGVYAWPDRKWTVTARGDELVLEGDGTRMEGLPLDEHSFLVDPADPDNPTVTFADDVLYAMIWGLPRIRG